MQHMRTISLALLLVGCNPSSFQEYLDTAPIRVHGAPDDFGSSEYGRVMVAAAGNINGKPVGRIVASGGGATPIVFTRQYDDGQIGGSTLSRCPEAKECPDGRDVGAALIPFERWAANSEVPNQICVFAPSNANVSRDRGDPRLGGIGYVSCEIASSDHQTFDMGTAMRDTRGSDDSTLVFSGFGLPPKHPLGVVLFGAYSIGNKTSTRKNGSLFVQRDLAFDAVSESASAPFAERVALVDPSTGVPFFAAPDAADLGYQVAGALAGDRLLVAISQPSKQRVIVASYDEGLPGKPLDKFRVHACIESPDAGLSGFGERVVVGDLTGDGAPEIVVGVDPVRGAEPGEQALFVYDGRSLPGPVTGDRCPPWDDVPVVVNCRDSGDLACAGSGFGASIAIGDVDADGVGDLIVGAPLTSVGGKREVGAVWLVPGAARGLDVKRSIAISVPKEEKARFGWAVAAVSTNARAEPAASAPGVGEIYTIMCTPLESGFGGSDLCLP